MIVSTKQETIAGYLNDTSHIKAGHSPAIYFPESVEEIAELLSNATTDGRRFMLSGNGTGTTGGRIPFGDCILSLQKLNHIGLVTEQGEGKATITVQAGALLGDIQKVVEQQGWLYPPDPTEKLCFIGSTIANNSSGARTFRYGATRNHIERLLIVLPTGDMLNLRRGTCFADADGFFNLPLLSGKELRLQRPNYVMPNTSKHNAGYFTKEGLDALDLFIGSEGTLGVIAEAELRLIALPEAIISSLVYFSHIDDLFTFIHELRHPEDGVLPRAIELFEKNALHFLAQRYPEVPAESAGAIFLEQEITAATEERHLDRLLALMERCNAMSDHSWLALDPQEQARLREFRHSLPLLVNDWLNQQQESKISADMAVPEANFRELYNYYCSACEGEGFVYIIFGHVGNDHVHLNILPRNHEEFVRAKALYRVFIKKVMELGGTLSAEHGIGKLKAEYLSSMYSAEAIGEMVRIKRFFDPHLTLNIGNVLLKEYLIDEKSSAM